MPHLQLSLRLGRDKLDGRSTAIEPPMPSTLIEVRQAYSPEEEVQLIEAVQAALVEGFKIPPEDRCVRLIAYEPHRFIYPPRLSRPERYTLVTVTAFAGRTIEAKRRLYRAIVERLGALDIPADHVTITLNEVERENWGLRGGQPASEIDLGFKVDV
ncbi:tautomerase family protein [Mitsuaria sp. GD03876]|uniref:tautomerase family protein n=1 Tax=Mitsuaria sp. GD03876 TaxID=2975399 RepID=UPI002448BE4A|nr:tautomerase family protein [Mitsuaria sp. GD03876]MDH0866403.1 tautomerase family protein [Mitsuaria sp. GD03876]